MELQLRAETEAKLNELARKTHRAADDLLDEAAIARGEVVSNDAVRDWLENQV
jgi:hypothetical protein